MKIPRPHRRVLAGVAALLVVTGAVVIGVQHSTAGTPPAAQEAAGIPYTASVSLDLACGPLPSARVTVDPAPGGHPDVHLEIIQSPYAGAPQHLFNAMTRLDLTMPGRPMTVTVPVEQSSTVSVYSADTSINLPLQQDLSCPQWQQQGAPNHP